MLEVLILSSIHTGPVVNKEGLLHSRDIPYKTFRMRKYDYFVWPDVGADSLLPSYNRMTVEAVEPTDSIYFNFVLRDTVYGNHIGIDSIRFIFSTDTVHPAYYTIGDTIIVVHLPHTVGAGQRFVVEVHYHGRAYSRPSFAWGNSFRVGVYWGDSAVFTHSEYYGTRLWLPAFDNLYEKVDTVDARIKVPRGWFAVSNGRLVDSLLLPDGVVYHWRESHGITPYMIVFAALHGDRYSVQDTIWTFDSVSMPVIAYTYGNAGSVLTYMLRGLDLFSTLYGIYPFYDEKYSEVHVGGGTEYQTNTFSGLYYGDRVVIHELSHQWWGGYVTCGTYSDLWLNEGFATYSELLYRESLDSSTIANYRRSYFNQYLYEPDAHDMALVEPEMPGWGWILLVYFKGAAVLHMIRYRFGRIYSDAHVGDSAFFDFLRFYRERHARSYVLTGDLQRDLESFTGVSWARFFEQWVYTPGHPVLDVKWRREQAGSMWNTAIVVNQIQSPGWGYYALDYPVRIIFSDSSYADVILALDGNPSDTFYFSYAHEPISLILDPQEHILDRATVSVLSDEGTHRGLFHVHFDGDALVLKAPSFGDYLLRVYDVAGRMVYRGEFRGNHFRRSIPVASGIYLVEVIAGGKRHIFRVVKS